MLRYGINFSPAESAEMTSPKAESDLLMLIASLRRSAVAPVFACRSEPAKVSDHKKSYFNKTVRDHNPPRINICPANVLMKKTGTR